MKIGINGQRLLVQDPAGPERYTYNLINALAKIDRDNEYRVYFNGEPGKDYFPKLTYSNNSFKPVVVKSRVSWTQSGLAKELKRNPVDVFFTPVHTMPIYRNKKLKVVGMIHGLEYKFVSKSVSFLKRLTLGKPEEYLAKKSHALIVPTLATKNEIIKREWIEKDDPKISIVHEGAGENFYKREAEEISAVRKKYGLGEKRYILFVSTIQPRKNIPVMVQGYAEALKKNPDLADTHLLIVGKKGWDAEESYNAPKKFGVEANVLFPGFLSDDDLASLFSGAEAFISVSLEEGFGLPLLEAMACETPALVSDIPAFKEVGGEFPLYVKPNDYEEIGNSIALIFHGGYKPERIYGAKLRAQEFTWDRTAQKTLEIIQKVAENS